jgi:hypothetical protein
MISVGAGASLLFLLVSERYCWTGGQSDEWRMSDPSRQRPFLILTGEGVIHSGGLGGCDEDTIWRVDVKAGNGSERASEVG